MNSVGIDIGTTGICGICVDTKSGEIIKSSFYNNDTFIRSVHEYEKIQDCDKITDIVFKIADELCDSDTRSIGFSNQMHGILYTDKNANAISPLYIWQDARGSLIYKDGKSYAEYLNSFSGYGLVTDFYNRENGLVKEETAYAMTIGDYAVIKLCGLSEPLMHTTNAASFGLFDINNNKFTVDLPYLPEVTADFSVVGYYKNIPVTVSVGDNQASFIGSVRDNSSALINIGTGSQISVICDNSDLPKGIEARPFADNKFLAAGCALCGGRAFKMAERFIAQCAEIATGELPESLYKQIDEHLKSKDCSSMTADTRFCGTRLNPDLKGSFLNIDESNFTPLDMLFATLEGMSRELYDMYVLLDIKCNKLVCSGNGIRKNPTLKKIIQKMFNIPLSIPLYKEEAAYGAAISSMAGTGIYSSLNEARKLIKYEGE